MNSFEVTEIVIIAIWMATLIKMSVDQMKLYKAYKESLDATLPLSSDEVSMNPLSQFRLIQRYLKIIFTKYPNMPKVDKLARIARWNIFFALGLFLLIIIVAILFGS